MTGEVKTAIVVKGGLVCDVYSTCPSNVHDIELLDLDNAGAESETAKEEMEARIREISGDAKYHRVL